MNTMAATPDLQTLEKADWLIISEAILRVSQFASLDDLLHQALDSWLQHLAPSLRWKVALELYTSEEISLGRAAEIAGLNYFVFMEKLKAEGIALVDANVTTDEQQEQQRALLDEILNLA